jgi:hypothetical protein
LRGSLGILNKPFLNMKDTIFQDLISPLDAEELNSLFSSDDSESLRNLSVSFYRRKYLLSVPGGLRSARQAIYVRPIGSSAQKITGALLWEAMFGKNFRVIHWNILFDILLRTIRPNRSSWALMLILRLTATSKDARDHNTKLDPVRRIIRRTLQNEEQEK